MMNRKVSEGGKTARRNEAIRSSQGLLVGYKWDAGGRMGGKGRLMRWIIRVNVNIQGLALRCLVLVTKRQWKEYPTCMNGH